MVEDETARVSVPRLLTISVLCVVVEKGDELEARSLTRAEVVVLFEIGQTVVEIAKMDVTVVGFVDKGQGTAVSVHVEIVIQSVENTVEVVISDSAVTARV